MFHLLSPQPSQTLFLVVAILTFLTGPETSFAQQVGYTNNTADAGLRSEMRVDPSTLALGFQLSLGNYPGRAGSSLPINVSYSSKVWRIAFEDIGRFGGTIDRSRAIPRYAEHSAAGWTTNFDLPYLEGLEWQPYDGLGAGICLSASCPLPDAGTPIFYVYRLLAHMPDGSTHELRRDDTPTQSHTTGNVYYAVDGSRIRYEESNQTLFLPDGSRYVFATNSAQFIDRNGNTLNYNQSTKQWTDTLGRTIGRPPLGTATTGYVTYTIPGVAGSTLTYRLRWRNLSEVLTNPDPNLNPLRYKGDRTWSNPMQTLVPSLFSSRPVPDEFVMTEVAALFNPVVLNEVELPNGRRYTFTYNVWGEIDKVVYPTGGYERYVHGPIDGLSASLKRGAYAQANRGVVDRWVSVKGDGSDEAQNHWHYEATHNNFTTPYTVTITAPDLTYSKRLLHGGPNSDSRFGFEDARNGMSYDESSYSATGQMLRRSLTEWINSGPLPGGEGTATRDPRVNKQVEILLDTGGNALTKTTTFGYDADLNRISASEYDYVSVTQTTGQTGTIGAISPGSPLRTSETTYLVNDTNIDGTTRAAYRARNLLGLVSSTRVKIGTGTGTIVAQSSVSYDEASYPLLTYGATTGWADPGTNVRGNATSSASWLNTTGTWLQTHAQYDQAGNVRNAWDAKGNQSQMEYSSSYAYAYPTLTRTAVPDPSGQYGSTTAFTNTSVFDFNTGLVISKTDANNQMTTVEYGVIDGFGNPNPLQRLTRVNNPDGGWTSYAYGQSMDAGLLHDYVRKLTALSASATVETWQFVDGLGRPVRTFLNEGGAVLITSDTQYDSLGRAAKVSNPYRTNGSSAGINPSGQWTTTGFDALSRIVSVTTPDNAVVSTSYSGATVTVTDQAGKQRRSVTDGLGRLKEIYEDPNGVNYLTSYSYDVLDNLTTVTQGVQIRTFVYDSLKRLKSAMNPESGTICYGTVIGGQCQADGYDANGNLIYKTDARGVRSTYAYDALNRNTSVVYTNDPAGTPAVYRYYDGLRAGVNNNILNSKGRLWQTETGGAAGSRTTRNSFDAAGRPLSESQQFYAGVEWSQPFTVGRQYNLAGRVTLQTYPSGHRVTYNYDVAGRLADKDSSNLAFTGSLGDNVTRTYSSGIVYSPLGGIAQEQFGTDTAIYNKLAYNSRGQLAEIKASTTPNDSSWTRGKLVNWYSLQCGTVSSPDCNAADNNGNLRKQETFVPKSDGTFVSWYQQYEYDSLNRLIEVHERANNSLLWHQSYAYDRYGNRTINASATSDGINKLSFEVETATNRLLATGDSVLTGANISQRKMRYDQAGNLSNDSWSSYGSSTPGAVTRNYDAENRMTSALDSSGGISYYTYNADGQRVQRKSGTVETWQVYGMDGELLAEYSQNAPNTSPQKEYGYRNGQLLITADASALPSVPVFSDNFNDNSLDPTKWSVFDPTSSATATEQAQQLRVTLLPNTAAYNGVYSNSTYDIRGKTVQVEVQPISQAGWCENYLQVVLDSQNYFLINVGAGTMIFRSRVNGVNDTLAISYDPTALPFWRLRHDQAANTMSFETSSNGINWTTRKTVNVGFSLTAVRFYLMAGAWGTGNASPGAAKYDNFQLAQSGASPAVVTNLALNKPATQISTYTDAVAGRAVDGNTNGAYWSGSVTHTVTGTQDWWQVDLGNSYALETIKVWNRTDCCGDRLSNFYVFVSDQPFSSGDLNTTLNQAGVNNYYTAGQGGSPTYVGVNRTGRYVRVQLSTPGIPLSLAEVEVMGSTIAVANLNWLLTDQLGTPRMVFDKTGSLAATKRRDYLPFGEELTTTNGLRTAALGYGAPDGVRQKFTSKERDIETGLDYSINRYYSPTQGRFTSADPLNSSGIPLLPQSWNRYSYTINNPLLYVDPKGLIWGYVDHDGIRTFTWYGSQAELDKSGDTVWRHSQFFSNQAGTDAVYLGTNGNARHISQDEYAAGVVDEFLRGPNSPLGEKEKTKLNNAFGDRIMAEHPEWNFWAGLIGGLAGGLAGSGKNAAAGAASGIDVEALTLTRTVANHLDDVSKLGVPARPYLNSRLVMREIMEAGKAVPDPGGVPGALRWDVPGAISGTKGTWELVIDPTSSTVLHFVFKRTK